MSIPVEILEAEVLSFPQADRSRPLDRLLVSLERDPELEAAWASEADCREERITQGTSSWVSGPEAVAIS